jgi:hypothetical protein
MDIWGQTKNIFENEKLKESNVLIGHVTNLDD